MTEPKSRLHCGACMAEFETLPALSAHIDGCVVAKTTLLPITLLMFGASDPSHKAAHLCQAIPLATEFINAYASAVAHDVSSWERSVIHKRLCERLGLDYATFAPFHTDEITEIPTVAEARKVIYTALREKVLSYMAVK